MADLLAGGNHPGLGSICCFGFHAGGGESPELALLCNQHVLHAHGGAAGSLVFQPGSQFVDGKLLFDVAEMNAVGVVTDRSVIGHVDFAYGGAPAQRYFVDGATATLLQTCSALVANRPFAGSDVHAVVPAIGWVAAGKISRLHPADVGLGGTVRVWKCGRSTGVTTGVVLDVKATVCGPMGGLRENVIVVRGWEGRTGSAQSGKGGQGTVFCNEGDSGAPLFDAQGALVGMLWGRDPGRPEIGYACHIQPLLAALDFVVAQPWHFIQPKRQKGLHHGM